MSISLSIGQWQGFYQYGEGYGEYLVGKEAEFRMFIEEYADGVFKGRVIDWAGIAANGQVSILNGFIENNFISMTKEYPEPFVVDKWGNEVKGVKQKGHTVEYEGFYEESTNRFVGSWGIVSMVEGSVDIADSYTVTGTWYLECRLIES